MNVHRLRYHESSFWKEPREFSHGPFEPAATRARQHIWCRRRSFFCFVFLCVCTDTKRERGLNETEGKERITKTARAYLLGASQLSSGMASPHQHQSIISTSCWDRKVCRSFERAHSSGSSWSHAHYSHTHTHGRTLRFEISFHLPGCVDLLQSKVFLLPLKNSPAFDLFDLSFLHGHVLLFHQTLLSFITLLWLVQ